MRSTTRPFHSQYNELLAKTQYMAGRDVIASGESPQEKTEQETELDLTTELIPGPLALTEQQSEQLEEEQEEQEEQRMGPQMMTPKPLFLKPRPKTVSKEEEKALEHLEKMKIERQRESEATQAWRQLPANKQLAREISNLASDPVLQAALMMELRRQNITSQQLRQMTPQQYVQLARQVRRDLMNIATQLNQPKNQLNNPTNWLNPNNPANPNNIQMQLQNGNAMNNFLFSQAVAEGALILQAQQEEEVENQQTENLQQSNLLNPQPSFSSPENKNSEHSEHPIKNEVKREAVLEGGVKLLQDAPHFDEPKELGSISQLLHDALGKKETSSLVEKAGSALTHTLRTGF